MRSGPPARAAKVRPRHCAGSEHEITIQSTQGRPGFGSRFVADGDTIVTHEVICRTGRRGESCWQEVRIRSVDGNEVIDRERLYLEPYVHHAFAINRGIVAVREAAWGRTPEQLVLFTGRDGAWRESERLVVKEDCQRLPGDRGDGLHLGDRTLVLGNHVTWCVYEQGTTGWHYSTSIKRTSQLNQDIGVSRDRFVVLSADGVDIYHAASGWRRSRVLSAPPGVRFTDLAIEDRWLVTRAGDVLQVYDLDAARLVATLSSQFHGDEFATAFAVRGSTIAATGSADQVWRFVGGTWQPRGALTGIEHRSSGRRVEVGGMIWIGDPRDGDGACGGAIHGFRIPD
jgi:hypothetical protein